MQNRHVVALLIGHTINGKDRGAVSYKGETESHYNFKVAEKVKEVVESKYNNIDVYILTKDGHNLSSFSKKVCSLYPDLSIEMHFNSFPKEAFGCEALCEKKDYVSKTYASIFTHIISSKMGIKKRHIDGVMELSEGDRGFRNLNTINKLKKNIFPVMIIEPCFANFKNSETEKFFEDITEYCNCYIDFFNRIFTLEEVEIKIEPEQIAVETNSNWFSIILETFRNWFKL
jgi:N-acetylmuramoyl-L-alanine amidase